MKALLLFAGLVVLAACTSGVEKPAAPALLAVHPKTKGLSPRPLAPGACGLFVWSVSQPQRFLVFIGQGKGTADVFLEGEETSFRLQPPNATLKLTQRIELGLKNETGRVLKLVLAGKEDIPGGSRYAKGTLVSEAKERWRRTIPIIGLSGCNE